MTGNDEARRIAIRRGQAAQAVGPRRTYVVLTRALGEALAVEDLRESGFEAYTPLCRKFFSPTTGKRLKIERAVLPRYAFVWTDDIERDFGRIRRARRVTGVVSSVRGVPLALTEEYQQWLARLVIADLLGAFDFVSKDRPKRHIGQQVRIIQGAFKGIVGTLTKVGERTSRVALEGRHVHGEKDFENDAIEEVASPPADKVAA